MRCPPWWIAAVSWCFWDLATQGLKRPSARRRPIPASLRRAERSLPAETLEGDAPLRTSRMVRFLNELIDADTIVIADVGDLLRYAQFQMGDGKAAAGEDAADGDVGGEEAEPVQIVQPDTLVQMHAPKLNRWGEKEQMGLAWFINDVGGTRQLSHGGGTLGQISLLCFFPEHKTALAVLTNATEGGAITDGTDIMGCSATPRAPAAPGCPAKAFRIRPVCSTTQRNPLPPGSPAPARRHPERRRPYRPGNGRPGKRPAV